MKIKIETVTYTMFAFGIGVPDHNDDIFRFDIILGFILIRFFWKR